MRTLQNSSETSEKPCRSNSYQKVVTAKATSVLDARNTILCHYELRAL